MRRTSLLFLCLLAASCGRGTPNSTAGRSAGSSDSLQILRDRVARQDSELTASQRRAEESAVLAGQARALSQLVAQIDTEVARVRLNVSNVHRGESACEGETACASAQRERLRERVRLLVNRVRSAEARMRATSKQLSTISQQDSLQKQQIADMAGTISSLRQMTERQQQELNGLRADLARSVAENATLGTANERLRHTTDSLETKADSVFFIAAPKATLLKLGVVQERGGSRLAFGHGKTLVPVALPPRSAFHALSGPVTPSSPFPTPRSGMRSSRLTRSSCSTPPATMTTCSAVSSRSDRRWSSGDRGGS